MSMAKKVPLRQCVGCGEMKGKKEMIRVLKTADNQICLDATGKKNGRGAYICRSRECLQKAEKNKGLERSFKMSIPKKVYDTLKEEFEKLETE
ncbi:MAG: YlxR family protein [Butyrivibrio sp.]|nr:YlxR family protein [Acetatifactor muris]MCM1561298.1 YlxR family protein [Butyrivibrio sp.]